MKIQTYSTISNDYDEKIKDGRLYVSPSDLFIKHRLNARLPKILSHKILPEADYTIWLDSNLHLKIDPLELLSYFEYPKVGVFYHTERSTINQELDLLSRLKWDRPERLLYHKNKKGILGATFLLIRKNEAIVNDLNEKWWAEICTGSSRDQLSFPYTLGNIATYKKLPDGNMLQNSLFTRVPHKKPREKFDE